MNEIMMWIDLRFIKIHLQLLSVPVLMLFACIACNGDGAGGGAKGPASASVPVQGDTTAASPGHDLSTQKDTAAIKKELKRIVFFGNSLTAGYGVEPGQAFPSLVQHRLDSLGLPYTVVNAGISGETTADGKNRIGWVLQGKTDIFILELGGNDGLRGIPLTETRKNLQAIIDSVRRKYPSAKIMLTGMQVPPNMGQQYTSEFRHLYRDLADKNKVALIPFLLEGVGGEPELNQKDGIHPNVEGHRIVSETVWKALKGLL